MRKLLLAALLVAGCDAYDENLGPAPFFCGEAEPRCPNGYSCMEDPSSGNEVCIPNDDSFDQNFDCNDDSDSEPNDTIPEAAMTTIDAMMSFSVDKRAICPANDKDNYVFTVAGTSENIELNVTSDANGAALYAAVLNTGGVPIAEATATAAEPTKLHAVARNLPAGTYYAHVEGKPTGSLAVNNYKLTLDVVP